MRIFCGIVLLSFLIPLSGCLGLNPFCTTPCPEGEIRDSFCGCMKRPGPATGTGAPPFNQSKPYMIARYSCVEVSDPSQSAGSCDILQSGDTCEAAKSALLANVASRGDPCMSCTAGTTDPTKKSDGNGPQWIQGGPCTGVSMGPRKLPDAISASTVAEGSFCNRPARNSSVQKPRMQTEGLTSLLEPGETADLGIHSASLVFVKLESPAAAERSCVDLCPKSEVQNGNCSVNKIDNSIGESINKLRSWSLSNKPSITPEELRSNFHLEPDPCERGKTILGATNLTNDGPRNCYVRSELPNLSVTAELTMPKHIEATWDSRTPVIKLTFKNPANAPSLVFFNNGTKEIDAITENFGGVVKSVEADSSRLFLRVPNGCVGVIYEH